MQRIAVQENEANRSLQARTLQVRTDIAQPRLNVKNAGRVIWLSIAKRKEALYWRLVSARGVHRGEARVMLHRSLGPDAIAAGHVRSSRVRSAEFA